MNFRKLIRISWYIEQYFLTFQLPHLVYFDEIYFGVFDMQKVNRDIIDKLTQANKIIQNTISCYAAINMSFFQKNERPLRNTYDKWC